METVQPNETRTCSRCHRTLPADHFYRINKSTGKPDAYCKDCRRQLNRQRQDASGADLPPTPRRPRTLIFEEPDRERRMQLIMQARRVVQASIMRKQRRMREEGD